MRSPGPARILIADDQPDVLEALRLLLKSEGYQIEAVNSPAGVLEKLKSNSYDLLLMDLNYTRDTTSGEEGLDLLTRIQAIDQTLPVVAMTAWGSIELAVEAMRRGVRDFVLKPWENPRLLQTLRSQIRWGRQKRNEIRIEKEEVEDARAVGAALLPQSIPQLPGIEISSTLQPARPLSGDYFDVLDFGAGKLGLCIADVVGKGVSAALLMSNVQASVRALAPDSATPRDLMIKLNRSVARNTTPGKFVTFFYCTLDRVAGRLHYANAGHSAPALVRESGEVVRLEAGGAVLGVFPEWNYEQGEIEIRAGDRLLLFTDGVTEASNIQDEEFGEERLIGLASVLRDRSAAELKDRIMQAVTHYAGGRTQDDATLVVVALS